MADNEKKINAGIEQNISSAVEKLIPDDMYDRVARGIVLNKERTKPMKNTYKSFNFTRFASIAAALLLVLAIGVFGAGYYRNNFIVSSIVDIDVNPSVELSVNRNERVIKVEAVNTDGKDLLDGMDLKNTDLDVALNAIIGAMVKNGYFNGEDGKILVTVQNNDAAKASEIRTLVVSDIDAALKANSAGASILNQTVSADSQAETFAKEQGISIGKAVFVLNLAALGGDLDPAALSKMSLTELAELVKEKKLDIGKIIDYDADDSLFENIAEGIEDAQLVGIKAELEVAEAKAAALIAAGISGDKASFIKAELERDDGRLYYDIKFRADNVVYEFEINAVTGVIEDREEDREKAVASSSSSAITVEQAKKAALDHAGADSTARVIHAELDKEDGRLVYEVEFVFANAEYEYEIDAATGEIVSYDMEGVRLPAGSGADPEGSRITAEQAEDIALAHAGVARADAVLGLTELDKDDGRTVYEVSFRVDRLE